MSEKILTKNIFEYIFMYFYGSNLGPIGRGQSYTLGLSFVKDQWAMLQTKCQASESYGSEDEEDF